MNNLTPDIHQVELDQLGETNWANGEYIIAVKNKTGTQTTKAIKTE